MKKGLPTLLAGIGLVGCGALLAPMAIFWQIRASKNEARSFVAPGHMQVNVAKAGRYYLWNEYRTVFEGRIYQQTPDLPDGLQIAVRGPDGLDLPFHSDTSISSNSGGSAKNSVGFVEVPAPAPLIVSVTGDSRERVFSFGRFDFGRLMASLFALLAVTGLLVLTGVGVALWGIIKLNRRPPGPAMPPLPGH